MTETTAEPQGPAIYPAMAAILGDLPAIGKDQYNAAQRFSFRGIDDVLNALNPIMAKHRVFLLPQVLVRHQEEITVGGKPWVRVVLRVRYTFTAWDGSSVSAVGEGEGQDGGDKATSKAMTMAMKYVLFQVFAISTEEASDPDAGAPPQRDAAPAAPQEPPLHQQSGPEKDVAANLKERANGLPPEVLKKLKQAMKTAGLPGPDYMTMMHLETWQSLIQAAETEAGSNVGEV